MFKLNIFIALLFAIIIITFSTSIQKEEMKKKPHSHPRARNTRQKVRNEGYQIDRETFKKIRLEKEEECDDGVVVETDGKKNNKVKVKMIVVSPTNNSNSVEKTSLSEATTTKEQVKEKREKTKTKKTSSQKQNVKKKTKDERVVEEETEKKEYEFVVTPYQKQLVRSSRKSDTDKFDKFNMNLDVEIGLLEYLDAIENNKIILSQINTEEKKIDQKIREWMKSIKLYSDEKIENIDIKKELSSFGRNNNFANVVDFIKESIIASDAFNNMFQNNEQIEDYAKRVIEDMRLCDVDENEITMIENSNMNVNPNVYSKTTLSEKINFVSSLMEEGKTTIGFKRKGKTKKICKHKKNTEENSTETMILKDLNLKKEKFDEKQEEISEIKCNNNYSIEKELKQMKTNNQEIVYMGTNKIEKSSNELEVQEVYTNKQYPNISPKIEGEWCCSFVLDLFLLVTETLWDNDHYIIPMNCSDLLINGNRISTLIETKLNLCVCSNKVIHCVINKNGTHWICVTVDPLNSKLHVIDSLRQKEKSMKQFLKKFIEYFQKLLKKKLQISFVNIPTQKTGWDSGNNIMFYLLMIATKCWLYFSPLETYFDDRRYDSFLQIFAKIKENIYESIQIAKETTEKPEIVFCQRFYHTSLNAFKSIL